MSVTNPHANQTVEFGLMAQESVHQAAALFRSVFSDAESDEEGSIVENVVRQLGQEIGGLDVVGYEARVSHDMVGAIFFSRMTFDKALRAFLLAPVVVATSHQGRGIGQSLIQHGLDEMAASGVQFVATYGDPAFYSKVGFRSIAEHAVRPPFKLTQPEGWLGQSLEGNEPGIYSGRFTCVGAFSDASLW